MGYFRLVVVVTVAALAADTDAAPGTALQWTRTPGTESCIDEATLITAVEQRLGRSLDGVQREERVVSGVVDTTIDGYRARIVVRDREAATRGERELLGDTDCRSLTAKLILVIALIFDPDAAEPPPSPSPSSPPPLSSTAVTAAPPRTAWTFVLGASGTAAIGVMPGIGVGGRLMFGFEAPSLPPVEVSFTAWVPDQAAVDDSGIALRVLGAGLAACPRLWTRASIPVRGCVGGEFERLTATGFGFDANQRTREWIGHLTAGAGLQVPLHGRWAATFDVAGWVALVRPRFVYADSMTTRAVYQAPVAAGLVRLGVVARF